MSIFEPNAIQKSFAKRKETFKRIADYLGISKPSAPIILVGGTNGKGTACAVLSALYKKLGVSFGCFTSPHLLDFKERINVNGASISAPCFYEVEKVITLAHETNNESPFWFDALTLGALFFFKEKKVSRLILEVGLGGRLDATNLTEPSLSLLTPISLDHQERLGNTRSLISLEKIEIARRGLPLVLAEPMPRSLYERAKIIQPKIYEAEDYFQESYFEGPKGSQLLLPQTSFATPSLIGALTSFDILEGHVLSSKELSQAILNIQLKGRLEEGTTKLGIPYLLDVAHNQTAFHRLASYLQKKQYEKKSVSLLFNAGQNKEILPMVSLLLPWVKEIAVVPTSDPRTYQPKILQKKLSSLNIDISLHQSIKSYLASLKSYASLSKIVVTGSFALIGDFLNTLNQEG